MPTIEPANTQQVLQMSPLAEKPQQATQQQPAGLVQQLNQEDNIKLNELKRTEVQDPNKKEPSDQTNPDGRAGRGSLRTKRNGKESSVAETEADTTSRIVSSSQGNKIDVVI